MENSKKYVRKEDFHKSAIFLKINRDINTCLKLIEKLISVNKTIWKEVTEELKIPNHIIDYRIEQFGYYENTLKGIFYSCYSLKYFFEISTRMNFGSIHNTLGQTLDNQRRYITFNAIVKLSSIFEFARREYERTVEGKNYYDKMAKKYSDLARSTELLNNFRNTIHSNGIWGRKSPLEYDLREGRQVIQSGEPIKYDHWKLYRMVKESLELHKILALENKALNLRKLKLSVNGQQLAMLETDLNPKDLDKIFENKK